MAYKRMVIQPTATVYIVLIDLASCSAIVMLLLYCQKSTSADGTVDCMARGLLCKLFRVNTEKRTVSVIQSWPSLSMRKAGFPCKTNQ